MKSPYLNEEFLTPDDVAKIKKVSRQAVHDAIKAGKLPCHYILGRRVIRKADLRLWQVIGRRKNGPLSVAHKAKISQSQKRRWANANSKS